MLLRESWSEARSSTTEPSMSGYAASAYRTPPDVTVPWTARASAKARSASGSFSTSVEVTALESPLTLSIGGPCVGGLELATLGVELAGGGRGEGARAGRLLVRQQVGAG